MFVFLLHFALNNYACDFSLAGDKMVEKKKSYLKTRMGWPWPLLNCASKKNNPKRPGFLEIKLFLTAIFQNKAF